MKKPSGKPAFHTDPLEGEKQAFAPVVVGSGRNEVQLDLQRQGDDLILRVTGGRAHVGAVGIWERGLDGGQVHVIELPHHKEGPLARECAETLGRAAGCTAVAVVGIHQDQATSGEIATIIRNVQQGVSRLAESVRDIEGDSDD